MRFLVFAAWACVLATALEEISTESAFKKTLADNMAVVVDVREPRLPRNSTPSAPRSRLGEGGVGEGVWPSTSRAQPRTHTTSRRRSPHQHLSRPARHPTPSTPRPLPYTPHPTPTLASVPTS